jgi:anaerobic selenocysteine-containing dehydrogenase
VGSFDELLRRPHGVLRPGHRPGDFLGHRVLTDDGKVCLAPQPLLDAAGGFEAAFRQEREGDGLRLIGRRTMRTHNSWTHNSERFLRHDGPTNHLFVAPADAARLGLSEGQIADVTSATATVRVPVHVTDEMMPGTVALAHGWGHQGAPGLSVARRARGVNVNLLAPDGPDSVEPLSGMSRLTAIEVTVTPATGPQDLSSWSGLPATPLRA